MAKNRKNKACCPDGRDALSNCRVDSIVSVDERGQMVLPKELRRKANIKSGDKFAITTWGAGSDVCCIALIKVDDLVDMVKSRLGPVMKELL